MNNPSSIFQDVIIDHHGASKLKTTARWARFIGLIFVIIGIITLCTFLLLFFNADSVAEELMSLNGMSSEALDFFTRSGKWIFLVLIFLVLFVMALNAISLLKFSKSIHSFLLTGEELHMSNSFQQLGNYLKITVVLGVISVVVSILSTILSFSL